jgi:AcrR family transcriptional regulator
VPDCGVARPRQIDRSAILEASLAIADARGLPAVTMQAVADRLGVTPMALYRHVKNKADLLDGVVERLLDEVPEPAEDEPWELQLAGMGRALRATARRHPSVFPLLLQRPATTPAARRVRDRSHAALRAAGVAEHDVARVERLLSTMVLGFAASEASGRFTGHARKVIDADYDALEELIRIGLASYLPDA